MSKQNLTEIPDVLGRYDNLSESFNSCDLPLLMLPWLLMLVDRSVLYLVCFTFSRIMFETSLYLSFFHNFWVKHIFPTPLFLFWVYHRRHLFVCSKVHFIFIKRSGVDTYKDIIDSITLRVWNAISYFLSLLIQAFSERSECSFGQFQAFSQP